MSETRMPVQKRSVEKRERIIRNGFELMCNNGYFNTTTSDIAKYVGVSTGIIYQYFNDKKEIFIEGFSKYSDDIMFPILDILKNNTIKLDNMEKLLNEMLNVFIEKHTLLKRAHEEMLALAHLDEDIDKIFLEQEVEATKAVTNVLRENGIGGEGLEERVHIIIGIVENYCHEIVYHKHSILNYDVMKNEVINVICHMLKD
ncbi:MAG: TetR/AcrR family transcriptional regulator [Tenericutes bacterium]|nr:TetR/AcrR family transcriptional regulator [Mycoplasmatota bacterium]